MLALMLALAWAPLMSHCALETIPALHWMACQPAAGSESDANSHCDDGCCAAESSAYRAPAAQFIHLDFDSVLPLVNALDWLAVEPPSEFLLRPSSDPPPELLPTWQFVRRTALQPRAPSLAS